jgi:cell division transport system permease protein
MSTSFEKDQRRRLISSYFSVVLSITLVLFLLGILGVLIVNTKFISDKFKEKVTLTIYLEDSTKPIEINQLKNSLSLASYIKETRFVSKEYAADFMKIEYGEDFLDEIGYNPLKNSIEINLLSKYVTTKRLDSISQKALDKKFVEDVKYDKDLVELMNSNVKKLSFWALIICGVFTLIAILLINSSIRLAIYSKRFSIKTMQMVGATKKFIRKPFIINNIKLGIIGSILAICGNVFIIYYINSYFPELQLINNSFTLGILFSGILFVGILITWISTFVATQRFLNLKTDRLY